MSTLNASSSHSGGGGSSSNHSTTKAYVAAETEEDRVIQALDPHKSFSVIFRGDWTLDLMLLKGGARLRDDILDAIDQLLQTYQQSKVKVSDNVLLLRYVWLDADKVSS